VFCLLVLSIYQQVRNQMNWEQSLRELTQAFNGRSVYLFFCVMILMLANWSLEALKWKLLVQGIQPISWFRSFKATLTGLTFAFFTPNRMGEYVGRVVYIQKGNRLSAASLTVVSSMAQIMVTLAFGIYGLFRLKSVMHTFPNGWSAAAIWVDALLYITLFVLIALTFFYLRLAWFFSWMGKIPQLERLTGIVKHLQFFDLSLLGKIWLLSLVRYIIFIVQYYLLYKVFSVSLDLWQVFWSVSIVFLVLAVFPSIAFLTDLGLRWKTSIEIMQLFNTNSVGILATALTIWVINLVIPALAGSLLLLNIRIFRIRSRQAMHAGLPQEKEEIV
jgi:hypothetical protein